MKKLLVLCVAVMAFSAPAQAQLFMAWNACDGTTRSSTDNKDFDCTPGSGFTAELWGTLGLSQTLSAWYWMDGIIDLAFQGVPDVPPFWHFEAGGCGEFGIRFSWERGPDATYCNSSNSTSMCGPGPGCGGGITAYLNGSQTPLGGSNRARMAFTIGRIPERFTTSLPRLPARVFAFHITFTTDNVPGSGGADCTGCETPVAFAWNQAILYNNSPFDPIIFLDSTMPGSTGTISCNGATISVGARKESWGRLKSLYR